MRTDSLNTRRNFTPTTGDSDSHVNFYVVNLVMFDKLHLRVKISKDVIFV